jgi:hypothetical protein
MIFFNELKQVTLRKNNIKSIVNQFAHGVLSMNKPLKLFVTLGAFAVVAGLVYVAGEMALSDSPLLALAPVTLVLLITIVFIRMNDKQD